MWREGRWGALQAVGTSAQPSTRHPVASTEITSQAATAPAGNGVRGFPRRLVNLRPIETAWMHDNKVAVLPGSLVHPRGLGEWRTAYRRGREEEAPMTAESARACRLL